MLIKSAVRRAKSTGAKYTPAEIAKLLTTEPSDIESESNDVLLQDLEEGGRGDEDCRNTIREVTTDDFAEKEGGSSEDEKKMVIRKRVGHV